MEEDEEEPWYSWRALATGQGEEDDALDEFDLDDRRYLAVETVYSGFRWCAQGPGGGGLNLESMKVRPAGMSGLVALDALLGALDEEALTHTLAHARL